MATRTREALGFAEDEVSETGDTGLAVLAVRRDVATSAVSADGDYAFLSVDASGNLRTTASVAVTITGGATEATQLDVKRAVTDFRTLLDYDGRIDGNPVYVGKDLQTTLVATATWTIQKLFYDVTNRLVDAQVLTGAWTGRAALAWKPAGGD